jgi:hypothetical protein
MRNRASVGDKCWHNSIYNVTLNYCRCFRCLNFQIGRNKIKLFMEYKSVTQKVLFGNAVLAILMSGRKYGVISKNFLTCIFPCAGLGVMD